VNSIPDASNELEYIVGNRVYEIRPTIANKGRAVTELKARAPRHWPLYIGDDVSDEDAFNCIGQVGLAIKVGQPLIVTAATAFLPNPTAVSGLLELLVARGA
jgi:trehalose 6-phosphate phosphatase